MRTNNKKNIPKACEKSFAKRKPQGETSGIDISLFGLWNAQTELEICKQFGLHKGRTQLKELFPNVLWQKKKKIYFQRFKFLKNIYIYIFSEIQICKKKKFSEIQICKKKNNKINI